MIDISNHSEQELRALNKKIVARIRHLHESKTQGVMLKFNIGEAVTFNHNGETHFGMLTRFNKKSVTVIADDGVKWTIDPSFLSRVNHQSYREKDVTPKAKVIGINSRSKFNPQPVSRNAPCPCGSGKKYKRCCS